MSKYFVHHIQSEMMIQTPNKISFRKGLLFTPLHSHSFLNMRERQAFPSPLPPPSPYDFRFFIPPTLKFRSHDCTLEVCSLRLPKYSPVTPITGTMLHLEHYANYRIRLLISQIDLFPCYYIARGNSPTLTPFLVARIEQVSLDFLVHEAVNTCVLLFKEALIEFPLSLLSPFKKICCRYVVLILSAKAVLKGNII